MKLCRDIIFLTVSAFCFSCSTNNNKTVSKITIIDTAAFVNSDENFENKQHTDATPISINSDSLIGYYVGYFDAVMKNSGKHPMERNKINFSIDSIKNDSILYGHSVVAGNFTSFSGSLNHTAENIVGNVKEIGQNKYNGEFAFNLNPLTNTISGKWFANDSSLPVTLRKYELTRKKFKYNPQLEIQDFYPEVYSDFYKGNDKVESYTEDAFKMNASTTLLTSKDVENVYKRDLELIRNAIYARHGYSFKNRVMRVVFDHEVDWYIPVSVNVTKELTELEKKNIELIKRYEKHATSYYDSFGR